MISITEKAADHIKGQLSHRGKGVGIRLGVKTTGCSGLAYVIEFADSENDDDNVFLDKGINVDAFNATRRFKRKESVEL